MGFDADIQGFREYWENQPHDRMQQQENTLQQEISDLKTQYLRRRLNRAQFYEIFENKSLNLNQLQRLM